MTALAMPTPMIEPISVCEEEAGRPKYQVPQVPDDRGDQECEHHGEAGAGADLEDQLDRQQRDDAERDRAGGQQHAEEVEEARPHHREFSRQRMGVDHGRHRVGGVVEAVDEFEAERDQQRDEQEDVGQEGRHLRAGRVDVDIDAVGNEQQACGKDAEEQDHRERVKTLVEIWPGSRLDRRRIAYRTVECNICHFWTPLN
ncbi:hypothetical protein ACVW0J_008107 [Bradyrhizobium sp. i1.7.7]